MMRPLFVRLPVGLVAAVSLVVACSDNPVSPISRVRYIALDVVPDTLLPGDTLRLAAQLLDADSNEVVATPVWSSSAPEIASVNQQGRVTAVGQGTAFIIAAAGQGADSAEVIVGQPPVIQLSGTDSLDFGQTATLTLTATGRDGAAVLATQVTWSSTDTGVVSVDPAGKVRATGYGAAQIIARLGTVADTLEVRGRFRYVESPAPLNSVSMGSGHFCGLGANGGAFCWGNGVDGQLGLGDVESAAAPTRVGSGVYTEVIAGDRGTCAVDASYALWCWGLNQYRQLATDTVTGARIRTPHRVLTDLLFEHVFVSQHGQVCATTTDDVPYCWGHNDMYQLGRGPIAQRDTIIAVVSGGLSMTYIRGSGFSTCGLDAAGAAWCWGDAQDLLPSTTSTPSPLKIANGPFRDLAVGQFGACAISTANEGFCWGSAWSGSLGNGDTSSAKVTTPQAIAGGHAWRMIAVADESACGVTTAGQLMCWGPSKFSASGLDATRPRAMARTLSFKAVATYIFTSAFCALTSDGMRVHCF